MKKLFVVILIFLFISMSINASTVGIKKEKTTMTTTGSRGYIQDLIDNASPGDTIYIPSGIYHENIIINKSISLIGENKETTIIDAGQEYGWNVVQVSADWVNISNFTVRNSSGGWFGGISIPGSNYVKIESNKITLNSCSNIYIANSENISIISNEISYAGEFGIYIDSIINCKILNNYIHDVCGDGIALCNSRKNVFDNNSISNSAIGLMLYATGGSIRDNIFSNNSFYNTGIHIHFWGEEVIFENNIFLNNIVNGKPLVYLESKSDIDILYAGQIVIFDCNNITIKNLELFNTSFSIELWDSHNCLISDNNISKNYCGIFLGNYSSSCVNNSIYHNNFLNNTCNAYDYGKNNWDDGKYGNYWSDYKERYPDAKPKLFKPWIWDTPYEIRGGDNKDNCPLIKQWPNSKSRDLPTYRATSNLWYQWFLERFPMLEKLLL